MYYYIYQRDSIIPITTKSTTNYIAVIGSRKYKASFLTVLQ
jgi:xanthine/CO dehydrogenase XdhC/CoxF family maturation factor